MQINNTIIISYSCILLRNSMKRIVSIDVGIKNLAVCLLSVDVSFDSNIASNTVSKSTPSTVNILKWDVINLTQKDDAKCCCKEKDTVTDCKSEVKYSKNGKYYCTKHSKCENYLRPSNELTMKFLKKQKVEGVKEIALKYCIDYPSTIKKADLIDTICAFSAEKCFESVDKIDATKLDIVTIGRNIHHKLNKMFDDTIDIIDMVIIENQISPIANRMKTVQGMLSQYFLMRNDRLGIEFISSINKLKGDELCETYSERKKAGITKCLDMIVGTHDEWVDFFRAHKKKDDLSDCFLQGMWYVQHRV